MYTIAHTPESRNTPRLKRLEDVSKITPLPRFDKDAPGFLLLKMRMLACVKDLRPVRQWIVRSETIKDKRGMFPSVLYVQSGQDLTLMDVSD